MKKTKFFLHIGHGKTGTSAVQSSLAIASDDLLSQGINYPIHPSLRDRSSQLEITSGNWAPNPNISLSDELLNLAECNLDDSKIILSSESLFWEIPELLQNKQKWESKIDLHILMAVRDIEEMISSEYQQRVKRHGDSMPFEQFIRARQFISSHHAQAAKIIELMSNLKISNTVINYSKHKHDISRIIFKKIGAEDAFPEQRMDGVIINRSLSRKELDLMIAINKIYHEKIPSISTTLSDALIKNQPKITSQQCKIERHQLEKLYIHNKTFLEAINKFLAPTEHLSTACNTATKHTSVDQDQKIRTEEAVSIKLIGDTLKEVLTCECKKKLSNETVDAVIALSQSGTVTNKIEIELLELAIANRPEGKALGRLLIRAKKKSKNI